MHLLPSLFSWRLRCGKAPDRVAQASFWTSCLDRWRRLRIHFLERMKGPISSPFWPQRCYACCFKRIPRRSSSHQHTWRRSLCSDRDVPFHRSSEGYQVAQGTPWQSCLIAWSQTCELDGLSRHRNVGGCASLQSESSTELQHWGALALQGHMCGWLTPSRAALLVWKPLAVTPWFSAEHTSCLLSF